MRATTRPVTVSQSQGEKEAAGLERKLSMASMNMDHTDDQHVKAWQATEEGWRVRAEETRWNIWEKSDEPIPCEVAEIARCNFKGRCGESNRKQAGHNKKDTDRGQRDSDHTGEAILDPQQPSVSSSAHFIIHSLFFLSLTD